MEYDFSGEEKPGFQRELWPRVDDTNPEQGSAA